METFIVKPQTEEQLIALKTFLKLMKIDYKIEANYSKRFVSKILQGREDIKTGKGTSINMKSLWI